MMQVAAQVMGSHLVVTIAGQNAPLELNIMKPLIGYTVLTSIGILRNGLRIFGEKCVSGIQANRARSEELVELSMGLVTSLVPKIGYDQAARIALRALSEHKTVKEVVIEEGILTKEDAQEILDPKRMLGHSRR